jgi:hypothetical protein
LSVVEPNVFLFALNEAPHFVNLVRRYWLSAV